MALGNLQPATGNQRGLPWSAWHGLYFIVITEAAMLKQVEPFWSWYTPIAWTG
jgi:hypothetical protein